MVLATWVKKRQFRLGIEIGREEGHAEVRKCANAKLRTLAKEYSIPEENLQIEMETESS